jgi:D-alanyl-D-alanine carboxypeptidase (penicillin-binding protein 5/6)
MDASHRTRAGIAALMLVATLSLIAPLPALASIAPPSAKNVPSGVLMTIDGAVLWSRKPDAPRQTASTIKLLNALVLMDAIADHRVASLDTTVTVPKQASAIKDGGVGLVTGQQLTYRQLLNMMLIASANDAAEAVAIDVAGSQAAYVALMNAKAAALGLRHTLAVDPHGLDKHERSSADDLTILARHALADPVLAAIVRTRSVVVPRPGHKARTLPSTDLLLGHYKGSLLVGRYAGIEGVKTGFTNPAGYCFIGAAKRGAVELVGVVLGTKSNTARFAQMRVLLDWGFAHTHARTIVSPETTLSVTVGGGAVIASAENTVTRALLDGALLKTTVTPSPTAAAPVPSGRFVGTEAVGCNGVTLATVPLYAAGPPASGPRFASALAFILR